MQELGLNAKKSLVTLQLWVDVEAVKLAKMLALINALWADVVLFWPTKFTVFGFKIKLSNVLVIEVVTLENVFDGKLPR